MGCDYEKCDQCDNCFNVYSDCGSCECGNNYCESCFTNMCAEYGYVPNGNYEDEINECRYCDVHIAEKEGKPYSYIPKGANYRLCNDGKGKQWGEEIVKNNIEK
jgi:hypothetical protein